MLAANYNPGPTPPSWNDPGHGRIARYAWSADYHDLIKVRLYALDAFIRGRSGRSTPGKACVDTAPFLERDAALAAGLGFTGKNTVLITPGLGSWTFLAALLVPEILAYDAPVEAEPGGGIEGQPGTSDQRGACLTGPPEASRDEAAAGRALPRQGLGAPGHDAGGRFPAWRLQAPDGRPRIGTCGACTRCLDACPTAAFVGPHILDARRCISYLTIELRGPIPAGLRPALGNWVFGCDVCQEVCPYNRAAPAAAWPALAPDPERAAPSLLDLLALDEAAFRARYRGTAVWRARRRGLVRNACVAAGNWGDPAAVPALRELLRDGEPLVRGHAAWALGRIGGSEAERTLDRALAAEGEGYVRAELTGARLLASGHQHKDRPFAET